MTLLGSSAQACPTCGVVLEKMPKRKTKCRDCGHFIYVRTWPQDRQQVLLRESELEELEQQWVAEAELRPHIIPRQPEVIANATESLARQFGRPPRDDDVLWRIFSEEILQFSSSESWAMYAHVNFEMGEHLLSLGKFKGALHQYIIAFVLDVNGPNNLDRDMVKFGAPRFSGHGFAPPVLIKRIKQMAKAMEFTQDALESLTRQIAVDQTKSIQLPLAVEAVLENLRRSVTL